MQLTYTKYIDMLSKNNSSVKKTQAKLVAPVSSYSNIRLKGLVYLMEAKAQAI